MQRVVCVILLSLHSLISEAHRLCSITALALIGFDHELATFGLTANTTRSQIFGFASRRNNNEICLQNRCSYFPVHRTAARQRSVRTCARTRYSANRSRQYQGQRAGSKQGRSYRRSAKGQSF